MFYKILGGLVFIGLISLVVLNALGFINLWGIFFIAGFVFIIFGLYILLKKHSLLGGALFGFTGIVFLLAQFYDWVWVLLLPGLLLLIGIGIFFSRGKKTDPLLVCGDYSQEEVKISAFFNTAECYMRSDDFKGGYIHSTFGTARIDLSGVNMRKDVILDVDVLFGKVELILLGYVSLDNKVTSIIGEVTEDGSSGKAPVLHLKGTVVCGNIHVFFK